MFQARHYRIPSEAGVLGVTLEINHPACLVFSGFKNEQVLVRNHQT